MKVKRILAGFVAMAMTASMMSALVFADETEDKAEETTVEQTAETKAKETEKPAVKETEETKETTKETKPSATEVETEETKEAEETKETEATEPAATEPSESSEEGDKEPTQTEPSETEPEQTETAEPEEAEKAEDTKLPEVSDNRASKNGGPEFFDFDDLKYSFNDDTGVLTISPKKAKSKAAMTNNSSAANYPWYQYQGSITKVVISSGVTSIGESAFEGCKKLNSVSLPNSLTTICAYAFSNCSNVMKLPTSTAMAYTPPSPSLGTKCNWCLLATFSISAASVRTQLLNAT